MSSRWFVICTYYVVTTIRSHIKLKIDIEVLVSGESFVFFVPKNIQIQWVLDN